MISPDSRRDSHYREYSEQTIRRLFFIKRVKDFGFTLTEIKDLLDLFPNKEYCCGTVERNINEKISALNEDIRRLTLYKKRLHNFLDSCDSDSTKALCPVFEEFLNAEIPHVD